MGEPDSEIWRTPQERGELIDRLVRAERRCGLLERTLSEYAEHVGDDRADGSYCVALQARVVTLEANIAKLTQRRKAS